MYVYALLPQRICGRVHCTAIDIQLYATWRTYTHSTIINYIVIHNMQIVEKWRDKYIYAREGVPSSVIFSVVDDSTPKKWGRWWYGGRRGWKWGGMRYIGGVWKCWRQAGLKLKFAWYDGCLWDPFTSRCHVILNMN